MPRLAAITAAGPILAAALGWHLGLGAPVPVPSGDGAATPPTWVAPLMPVRVTRGFEPPPGPYAPGHRGVDLAGRPGQSVLAAGAGRVVFAGAVAGVGVVTLRHPDGRSTTYEPVTPEVRAGDAVTAGQVIATLRAGHPGCLPAACLHWGLRRADGGYANPLLLLGRGPPRLLPLDGPAFS